MGMTPNFNLDFLIDDQQDTLNRVYNKLSLSQNSDNPISDYVNSLSESDLNLLLDLNVDTTTPLEKIKKMMEDAKKVASEEITIDLSSIYEQLDNLQSAYQTVETAVKEYNDLVENGHKQYLKKGERVVYMGQDITAEKDGYVTLYGANHGHIDYLDELATNLGLR